MDLATGRLQDDAASAPCRRPVLAVPSDEMVWTLESRDGRPAAQASILSRTGFSAGVYACPDDRMIMGWLPLRSEVVLSAFADDAGDDADVVVASVRGRQSRPL